MKGFNQTTGKSVSGLDHVEQSVRDILTTRKGTRIMRRDYGSNLFNLIDNPINQSTLGSIRAETVEALATWEPRLRCDEVKIREVKQGSLTMDLTFTYLVDGKVLTINDLQLGGN